MPVRISTLTVTPAGAPAPAAVLLWVAAAAGAWFPARFAVESGVPRDSLDDPLTELRLAGLVVAAEWLRGVGQGYALTPAGKAVVADPAALDRLRQEPRAAGLVAALAPAPDAAGEEVPAVEVGAGDAGLAFRPPVVVPVLLVANAIWFFVCAVWGIRWGLTLARSVSEGHPAVLHRFGAVTGADLVAGEWWRLLSCCFVHIGGLHLLGNLFALAMMGPLAELLWGRWRLLLIYLVSGLGGSALAMALRPEALLAGTSGAIWGVQMSLFAWLFLHRRQLPPEIAADWFRRLTVVFVLNAAVSFLPGVSWEGHLGGGIAGFLAAGLLNAARAGDRARQFSAWLFLALLPVAAVAGLAGAMGAKGMTGWQKLHQRLAAERAYRADVEREKEWTAAVVKFEAEVAPRLAQLTAHTGGPAVRQIDATPAELEALLALYDGGAASERAPRAAARVRELKRTADEVAARTAGAPTGIEPFDRRRGHVHRYALGAGAVARPAARAARRRRPAAGRVGRLARRPSRRRPTLGRSTIVVRRVDKTEEGFATKGHRTHKGEPRPRTALS